MERINERNRALRSGGNPSKVRPSFRDTVAGASNRHYIADVIL